jgi:Fe2+ or Zn2+ uptake regulation protein
MAVSSKAVSAPRSPESVLNKMRSRGLRVSTPRRVVVQTLFAADTPLTATEIAGARQGAELDLATVYRNLETLQELEVVVRLQSDDNAGRWLLAEASGRDFVACHSCGAVEEVAAADLDDLRETLRERFGYELSISRFPLIGLCERCR